MSIVKDSVEAALDLDEKSVYSHIAHESAEDIIRIISSIDAERARLRGEVIYYTDDWDDLIRQRIAKGKRHTAFDFYNPALLDIWEAKVKKVKTLKKAEKNCLCPIWCCHCGLNRPFGVIRVSRHTPSSVNCSAGSFP